MSWKMFFSTEAEASVYAEEHNLFVVKFQPVWDGVWLWYR